MQHLATLLSFYRSTSQPFQEKTRITDYGLQLMCSLDGGEIVEKKIIFKICPIYYAYS